MEGTERQYHRARAWGGVAMVFAVVAAVTAFGFITSYSHIYDLGRAHAQSGTAGRLLPLSVDGLIIAATLVMFIQADRPRARDWRARWMPRLTLYAAIAATVLANVAYGLPSGWLAAVISGWPGAAFVAAVELGIIAVRLGAAKSPASVSRRTVPSSNFEAAKVSMAETAAAGNPWSRNGLQGRFGLSRPEADEIWQPYREPPAGGAARPPAGAPAGASNGQVPA